MVIPRTAVLESWSKNIIFWENPGLVISLLYIRIGISKILKTRKFCIGLSFKNYFQILYL